MVKFHAAQPWRLGASSRPAQPVSARSTCRPHGAFVKSRRGGNDIVHKMTRRPSPTRRVGVTARRCFPLNAARVRTRTSAPTPATGTRRCFGVSVSPKLTSSTAPASLGDVSETDTQHRKRHPEVRPDCPRCMYSKWRTQWETSYGSYRHEVHGQKAVTVWLAPRPTRLGGPWALGCIFCAHWAQQQADLKTVAKTSRIVVERRGRGPRDGHTKWARFQVRSTTQVAMRGISQHSQTMMHRKATRACFMPEPTSHMSVLISL